MEEESEKEKLVRALCELKQRRQHLQGDRDSKWHPKVDIADSEDLHLGGSFPVSVQEMQMELEWNLHELQLQKISVASGHRKVVYDQLELLRERQLFLLEVEVTRKRLQSEKEAAHNAAAEARRRLEREREMMLHEMKEKRLQIKEKTNRLEAHVIEMKRAAEQERIKIEREVEVKKAITAVERELALEEVRQEKAKIRKAWQAIEEQQRELENSGQKTVQLRDLGESEINGMKVAVNGGDNTTQELKQIENNGVVSCEEMNKDLKLELSDDERTASMHEEEDLTSFSSTEDDSASTATVTSQTEGGSQVSVLLEKKADLREKKSALELQLQQLAACRNGMKTELVELLEELQDLQNQRDIIAEQRAQAKEVELQTDISSQQTDSQNGESFDTDATELSSPLSFISSQTTTPEQKGEHGMHRGALVDGGMGGAVGGGKGFSKKGKKAGHRGGSAGWIRRWSRLFTVGGRDIGGGQPKGKYGTVVQEPCSVVVEVN